MDNKKKIIIGLIAGIIFIIAFLLNLLFPPKPFIKSAHADGLTPDPAPGVDMESLIDQYGYFVPLNQITQSDNMVDNIPLLKGWLPDDYTYGDFLLDTASAFIGNCTAINSETVDIGIQAIETLIDAEGFFLDTTSGFITVPNLHETLVDFQSHHGYSAPDGPVVGNWYSVPWSFAGSNFRCSISDVSSNSAPVYVCLVDSGWNYGIYIASFVSGQSAVISMSTLSGTTTLTAVNGYQGSESFGYYSTSYGMSGAYRPGGISMYSNINSALQDLFGWDGSVEDPELNGSVYIDDVIEPVNILSIPGNDGRNKSIQRNTDINNNIDLPYGGYNNIVLSPKLEDIPNNYEYELPSYPEIPHDLPTVSFEYPEISQNEEIAEGLNGLSPLWVTLLTMGGTFIVLKVIL